jgi:hypothetical protein
MSEQPTDTPHTRETTRIVAALDEMGTPGGEDLARRLQVLGSYESNTGRSRVLLLAVAFSFDELDALRAAVASSPKPRLDWQRHIDNGGHARSECLERPGEWCRGIGNHPGHPGRCDSCPTLWSKLATVKKVVDQALGLRRELDAAMWEVPDVV